MIGKINKTAFLQHETIRLRSTTKGELFIDYTAGGYVVHLLQEDEYQHWAGEDFLQADALLTDAPHSGEGVWLMCPAPESKGDRRAMDYIEDACVGKQEV